MMEGPGADSEEKHEPVSDIDTAVVVVGLKALDPEWPIREAIGAKADIAQYHLSVENDPWRRVSADNSDSSYEFKIFNTQFVTHDQRNNVSFIREIRDQSQYPGRRQPNKARCY
jgi:hypothetical protein